MNAAPAAFLGGEVILCADPVEELVDERPEHQQATSTGVKVDSSTVKHRAPTRLDLEEVVTTVAIRAVRWLEKHGYLRSEGEGDSPDWTDGSANRSLGSDPPADRAAGAERCALDSVRVAPGRHEACPVLPRIIWTM